MFESRNPLSPRVVVIDESADWSENAHGRNFPDLEKAEESYRKRNEITGVEKVGIYEPGRFNRMITEAFADALPEDVIEAELAGSEQKGRPIIKVKIPGDNLSVEEVSFLKIMQPKKPLVQLRALIQLLKHWI